MTHVQGFDSMDEAFGAMAAAEDAANANMQPGQIRLRDAVTETGYWVQALPAMDLVIYGVTPPIADYVEPGFDIAENRSRGYLTGTAYSAWETDGEAGDTHVSQVVPITAEAFEMAKALNWPTYSGLRERTCSTLAHVLGIAERLSLGRH